MDYMLERSKKILYEKNFLLWKILSPEFFKLPLAP